VTTRIARCFRKTPFATAIMLMSALPTAGHAEDAAPPPQPAATPAPDTRLSQVNVRAQDADDDDGDYNPGVSTVGGKTPTAIHDLPQTVTVIDRAVMQAQGAASLVDVLRNVPGIVLGSGEGGQIGNNIYLRGFSARTDVFLDGFRDRGQYQRDTFALDAIEVLEGPASLLFGRGSTGGVINQVSKRPTLRSFGEFDLTLGTDNYYRTTVDLDQALSGDSAFRLALMGQDVDATRSSNIENRDYGVAPSISFGIGTPTEVTLSLLSQHNRDVPDYGFPMVTYQGQTVARPLIAPIDNYYGYTNNRFAQDVNVFAIDLTHKFDHVTLRSNTQYSQYRTQPAPSPTVAFEQYAASTNTWAKPKNNLPASTPLDQLNVGAQLLTRSIRDSSLYNQTDLLFNFQTGPALHHFATGVEIGHDTYSNTQFGAYNLNYNNGAGLGSNLIGILNLGQSNDTSIPAEPNIYSVPSAVTGIGANTFATYFNDVIDIGEHWKLVGGLRWDQFSADQNYTSYCYTYKTPDVADPSNYVSTTGACTTGGGSLVVPDSGLVVSNNNPAQTAAVQAHNRAALQHPLVLPYSTSHADYHWSTRAGLIWQPDTVQSYYFAYGTSFDPLVLEGSGSTGTLPTSAVSEALYEAGGGEAPQTTESYEVGGKWELLHGNLDLSAAAFQVEMDNVRGTDPATGATTLDGDQRVRGAELKALGRITAHWQVIGGYTFLDGKTVASQTPANVGLTPPDMVKNAASLWSTYDFLKYWEVGGGVVFASNVWANANDLSQVPGYTRADATLAYRRKDWSLRLNLQNLTDRDYFFAVSGGRVQPADGRRALLTFSYKFL
jgi:catecholate siderophore receptor